MRRSHLSIVATLLVAIAVTMPAHAGAQLGGLGGLGKRVKERIQPPVAPQPQPNEITEANVPKLLQGFAAEARTADEISRASMSENAKVVADLNDYLARQRSYDKAQSDFRARSAAYEQCTSGAMRDMTQAAAGMQAPGGGMQAPPGSMAFAQKMASMSPAEQDAFEKKMDALEKRADAAQKSGNVAEQQRIRGEIEKLTGMSTSSGSPADAQKNAAIGKKMQQAQKGIDACGPRPDAVAVSRLRAPDPMRVRPVVSVKDSLVLGPQATQVIHDSTEARNYLHGLRVMRFGNRPATAGAQAAGVSVVAYSLWLEKVRFFLSGTSWPGMTEPERLVLQRHRDEIAKAVAKLSPA